jgi:ElaB protein
MGIFEKTGRELDHNVDDAKRVGRSVLRNARGAGADASAELRALIGELEDSLRDGKDTDIEALRARLRDQLAQARSVLDDAGNTMLARFESAVSATEDRIHQRPWEAIAAAAGISFLLGIIAAR